MKGIILAGGEGQRLYPLTKIMNKHLLPVWSRPMIYYPLQSLVASGITDIMIVTGGNYAGGFLQLLGSGSEFGLKNLQYAYQKEPGGIAQALGLAEDFADGEPICVMLGDNILENPFPDAVQRFERYLESEEHLSYSTSSDVNATIFLTEVERPEWYGVVEMQGSRVVSIEEKPTKPKSNTIAIGLYMYDKTVWDRIKSLKPSGRGELEVTDINNSYLAEGNLRAEHIQGWWGDAGESYDTYLLACQKAKELGLFK